MSGLMLKLYTAGPDAGPRYECWTMGLIPGRARPKLWAVAGPDVGENLKYLCGSCSSTYVPSSGLSPPARGFSPEWRDGALTLLVVLACLFGVYCSFEVAQILFKIL